MVTLAAPVAGPFAPTRLLTAGPTVVHAAVKLPVCRPAVAVTRRHSPVTDAALQPTALDDVQAVASQTLLTTRPRPDQSASPALDPSIVTLEAPVEAKLVRIALLDAGPTAVKAERREPEAMPTEATTDRDGKRDREDLHTNALEDTHPLVSQTLPAARARLL